MLAAQQWGKGGLAVSSCLSKKVKTGAIFNVGKKKKDKTIEEY
jgi:hypothetical protein